MRKGEGQGEESGKRSTQRVGGLGGWEGVGEGWRVVLMRVWARSAEEVMVVAVGVLRSSW